MNAISTYLKFHILEVFVGIIEKLNRFTCEQRKTKKSAIYFRRDAVERQLRDYIVFLEKRLTNGHQNCECTKGALDGFYVIHLLIYYRSKLSG